MTCELQVVLVTPIAHCPMRLETINHSSNAAGIRRQFPAIGESGSLALACALCND